MLVCPICLEPMSPVVGGKFGHLSCQKECIWIDINENESYEDSYVRYLGLGRAIMTRHQYNSKKGGRMYVIDEIKNSNVSSALEDLVVLSAVARFIQEEFVALKVTEPDWLGPKVKEIRREVFSRQADRRDKTLREMKARLETLKPAELKRAELEAAIAAMEAESAAVQP